MRGSIIILSSFLAAVALPSLALALPGIGPRITIEGELDSPLIFTPQQEFDRVGGIIELKASNGQTVTVKLQEYTRIIFEGRNSHKDIRPTDLSTGMYLRIRGWRQGSDSMTASLIVITNLANTASLNDNGTILSIVGNSVTVQLSSGQQRTFTVNAATDVQVAYASNGIEALSLVGKNAQITLNPQDHTQIKTLIVTGRLLGVSPDRSSQTQVIRGGGY